MLLLLDRGNADLITQVAYSSKGCPGIHFFHGKKALFVQIAVGKLPTVFRLLIKFADMLYQKRVYRDKKASVHWSETGNEERGKSGKLVPWPNRPAWSHTAPASPRAAPTSPARPSLPRPAPLRLNQPRSGPARPGPAVPCPTPPRPWHLRVWI